MNKKVVLNNLLWGVSIFIILNAIIFLFYILFDSKLTADGLIGENSLFEIICSALYILIWLVLTYIFGYTRNIGGIIALIAISLYPFLGLFGGVFSLLMLWGTIPITPMYIFLGIINLYGIKLYTIFVLNIIITLIIWKIGNVKLIRLAIQE